MLVMISRFFNFNIAVRIYSVFHSDNVRTSDLQPLQTDLSLSLATVMKQDLPALQTCSFLRAAPCFLEQEVHK